jgi:hypothetical protein
MKNLTYKVVRGTYEYHPHTLVLVDEKIIGYYTKNRSPAAAIDEKYNFTPLIGSRMPYIKGKSKPDLKEKIYENLLVI